MSVTPEVSQLEMSASKSFKLEKSCFVSVMAETSQSAMGPYVAMAAVGLASKARTAVFREALVAKMYPVQTGGGGDGDGSDGDGGDGDGGGGLGDGGEGLGGGGDGDGGEGDGGDGDGDGGEGDGGGGLGDGGEGLGGGGDGDGGGGGDGGGDVGDGEDGGSGSGDGDDGGEGDGGGGGGGGEGMYEIVLGPRVASPSETSDSAGWPPLLPTYPWRYNEPEQAPATTPPDARQKFQPPSPCRITINPSVRTQQPDEAS